MSEILNSENDKYTTKTFNGILEAIDFLRLPEAERLVTINPNKWVDHSILYFNLRPTILNISG